MSLVIRSTLKSDMHEWIELLQEVAEFRPKGEDCEAIWEMFSSQPHLTTIVAVADNRVVGYGSLLVEIKIRGGRMGHIEDIVSHSEYRMRGIGSAIVNALLNVARDKGCYKVALQSRSGNVHFYEKNGYTISGVSLQVFL